MANVDAVTFDFWNTLMVEERGTLRGRRLGAWMGVLEGAGFSVERERLGLVFDASWERFTVAWSANQQYGAVEAAEDILRELGFVVPDDVRAALLETFSSIVQGEHPALDLTPNVDACLRTLKAAGVRLGIICDVGMTPSTVLRAQLERRGVLDLFDHWSFSDEVGVYKPAPEIFEHALAGLGGIAPERAAHIGDLRRTDIAGALAMGITAVRYAGIFDDDQDEFPEAPHVIRDHLELPAIVGVS